MHPFVPLLVLKEPEKAAELESRYRAGVSQAGEAEAVLDRREQRVRRVGPAQAGAGSHAGTEQDRGDAPAPGVAAAARIRPALVEGDYQQSAGAELAEQRRNDPAEVCVCGGERAVVGVLTEVGADPCEGRQMAVSQVDLQPGLRNVAGTERGIGDDRREVHERVVLFRVVPHFSATKAGARHT